MITLSGCFSECLAHYVQSGAALNYSDGAGRSLDAVPPRRNSGRDGAESHPLPPLRCARQLAVSECLVNITANTVLSGRRCWQRAAEAAGARQGLLPLPHPRLLEQKPARAGSALHAC